MDVAQWYAISLGCVVTLPVAVRLISATLKAKCGAFYIRKYLVLPRLFRGYNKLSRLDVFILLLFLGCNVLCLTININDVPEFTKRSGVISVVNLVPLSLGSHMNFLFSFSGLSLPTCARFHRWLGRIALCEGLIHVAAAIPRHKLNLHTTSDIGGLAAGVIFVAIICTGPFRRYFYEVLSSFHLVFSTMAIGAIYIHMSTKSLLAPPVLYLSTAVLIQTSLSTIWFGHILYRNVRFGKPLNTVSIRAITFKRQYENDIPVLDAVHVHVRLTKPWKPQAGQYVYLCIPGLTLTSFAQLHPFYVSWWYRDSNGNEYIVLLVQRYTGFTKDLLLHMGNEPGYKPKLKAVIEGPYGRELALDQYGTVLLFATGIGITGQLLYVARLLEGYRKCEVKTRRIALFWEVQSESHTAWVAERMQDLLNEDTGKMLHIRLFVLGNFISHETRKGHHTQIGERIDITYDPMNVGALVESEFKNRRGRTIVSSCSNYKRGSQIREVVCSMMDETIHLEELDFSPSPGKKGARKAMFGRGSGDVSTGAYL